MFYSKLNITARSYDALHWLTHSVTHDYFLSAGSLLHFRLHVEMQVDIFSSYYYSNDSAPLKASLLIAINPEGMDEFLGMLHPHVYMHSLTGK